MSCSVPVILPQQLSVHSGPHAPVALLLLLYHREVKLRRPVFDLQVRRRLSEVQERHGLVATVFAGGFVGRVLCKCICGPGQS